MECKRPIPDSPLPCGGELADDTDPDYAGMCLTHAWAKAFGGWGWDQVDCIGCEIGRGCEHTQEEE